MGRMVVHHFRSLSSVISALTLECILEYLPFAPEHAHLLFQLCNAFVRSMQSPRQLLRCLQQFKPLFVLSAIDHTLLLLHAPSLLLCVEPALRCPQFSSMMLHASACGLQLALKSANPPDGKLVLGALRQECRTARSQADLKRGTRH